MIDRLRQWLQARAAGSEDATAYDGPLSYRAEWHALIIGLGTGFTAAVTARPIVLAAMFACALGISGVDAGIKFRGKGVKRELRREPWYAVGGGIVAYVVMGGRLVELGEYLPL